MKRSYFRNILPKRVAINIHPFFIFFFLIFFTTSSPAAFYFNDNIRKAYQEFAKLKISSGELLIADALKEDSRNGLALLVKNYGETLTLFITEEKKAYDQYKPNESLRLKQLAALEKNDPYYLFTQAEVQLQWVFVKLKFGEEVNAAWNIRQIFKLLEQNDRQYPDFLPNKKSLGLLNIIIGSIPDKYATLASLAGLRGDIQTGMKQLEQVATSNSEFAFEASLYKILAENYILKKENVNLDALKNLYRSNNDNLLLTFLYASLLIKGADCDQALSVLRTRPRTTGHLPFPYLDFLEGEIHMYKSEYPEAENLYQKFLHSYKGQNFIKDSYYKLFLCHWLSNEEDKAKTYLQQILKNGQEVYDSDKHAQKFAQKGEFPDKIIMKARLNFDGGYYTQAMQTLNTFPVTASRNKKDVLEYYYRKGRIFHALNNYSQAIIFYLKTIELSVNMNYYFAPNAALQMGYIYRKQGNKELARAYFKKALSYTDYEYKNSIDSKAKAALNELKNQ